MTLLERTDGESSSYPEIAELIERFGSQPREDLDELFRRMVFNVCIANVDDHLRNHAFVEGNRGLRLSPAYDLNPVPADIKPRILSTAVTLDDATGSLDAVMQAATYFGLRPERASVLVSEVQHAVVGWRDVAGRLGASKRESDRMSSAFLPN